MKVLDTQGGSWEVSDLSRAPMELQEAARSLALPPCSTRCSSCHRPKAIWEAMVADAGQMFETIPPERAVAVIEESLAEVHRVTGCSAVEVPACRLDPDRLAAGDGKPPAYGSHKFSFHMLALCFRVAMSFSFASIGDLVFQLSGGIFIGGVLARVAAAPEESAAAMMTKRKAKRDKATTTKLCW